MSETTTPTPTLNDQVQTRADELTQRLGVKIYPLVFKTADDETPVIGFIKEPPRFVKLRVMDKGLTSPVSAASEIVDAYLVKEESDPRIYSEAPENDVYYIGAVMEAYTLIKLAVNQFKKK